MRKYYFLVIVIILLGSCRKRAIKVDPAFKGLWSPAEKIAGDNLIDAITIRDGAASDVKKLDKFGEFYATNQGFAKITIHDELKIGKKRLKIELYPTMINDTTISYNGNLAVMNYKMKLDGVYYYKNDYYD